MAITGNYHVRALRSALQAARHFWPKVGDRMEVKRNALKLRWWGDHSDDSLLDLEYESVKTVTDVYELKLDDEIGGHRNIRVVFYLPADSLRPQEKRGLPMLWVLEVIPKKRQQWSAGDLSRFKAKRDIVKERFYQR